MENEYMCNLSGIRPKDEDLGDYDEELGDLPIGWKEITIKERNLNAEWLVIQQIKEQAFAESLNTIEKDQQTDDLKLFLRVQIASQYASLESITQKYIYDVKTAYISPIETDDQLKSTYNELLTTLDLVEEEK